MTTPQAPKQSPKDELIGRVINDRFRIISVIARGGMGRVYRAEQMPLGRLVAIKTLDPRNSNSGDENDPLFHQRFFLEASVASKLQHPNTVTVFDYGRTADGVYFIAMELVEGGSLYHLIREEAPLSPERTIHIAMQIARSLREAHRLDVIHRDLKPGNILLTRHGDEEDFVKVLDFGLVKHVESEGEQELTQAGLFMGSPKYMSPEQIRGERVDARADVYALGVVMYEMITGRVPFERENTVKVLMAHMHDAVPPIQVAGCPSGLSELIMRCLSKRPEGRPASMDEVILMLKQATGMPLTMSGQFTLSQELHLGNSPVLTQSGRTPIGTPSQAFVAGTHRGLSSAALSGESLTQGNVQPHPSQAPVSASQQPGATANTWLPRIVVIAAVLIAGGFLALRFAEQPSFADRPGQRSARQANGAGADTELAPAAEGTAAPAATGTATGPVPSGEAKSAPAQHVVVTVTSHPPGAQVTVDGKAYGETPADIEWWGAQAAQGREISFMLSKEGYEKATVVRSVVTERLNVDAQLIRVPSSASRPRTRVEPRNPPAPVVVPDNFKDDPY